MVGQRVLLPGQGVGIRPLSLLGHKQAKRVEKDVDHNFRSIFHNVTIATAAILLLCSEASAQYVNVNASRKVCGPLGCVVQDCKGSGVCIGKDDAGRSIVLTAGHCMSTATSYHVGHGEWLPASGVGYSEAPVDVGILATSQTIDHCIPVADDAPQPGSAVTVHSYLGGAGKKFHAVNATVLRSDENGFTIDAITQSGDSGGAVVQNGKLVGIVSATRFDPITQRRLSPSFITSAPAVKRFVISKLGKMPHCGAPAPVVQAEAPPPPDAPGAESPPTPKPDPVSTPQPQVELGPLEGRVSKLENDLASINKKLVQIEQAQTRIAADLDEIIKRLNDIKPEIAALKNRKLPVELLNAETGALIGDPQIVPLDNVTPLKIYVRERKVK